MNNLFRIAIVIPALAVAGYGQKIEFEAASIRVNPSKTFQFGVNNGTGGPGTGDPGMYRCTNCTLATLIAKAFNLQNYQFPGRTALGDGRFDVVAKIKPGATQDEFEAMMQNLLKERFGLAYHFTEKNMRGYHLTVAAKGSKLQESSDEAHPVAATQHGGGRGGGQGEAHSHSGPVVFGGNGRYKGDHQTMADLARILSDQLSVPVDDQTWLKGKYDIALNWSGDAAAHAGDHGGGAWNGSGGHGDHGGGAGGAGGGEARAADASGPTLFEALQSQLGLKLTPSNQAAARIMIVDKVQPLPTEN